jgi:membrane associated rhomboid family serine protease
VTGGIALMATAITVMTWTGRWTIERFEVTPTAFTTEPWRLLTSALPHGDALHLLFNVYWLWVFGTLLEDVLGHVRLLALITLFGAVSAAAEFALFRGGIGLSGVGYGLFGMLWVLSSRDARFADAVDARTAQGFAAWFVFCIVATKLRVMAIANVAHGVGALLGILVGAGMSARVPRQRVLAGLGVPAVVGLTLAGATVLRPRVNLIHDGHPSFALGYAAIQAGRYDDAIRHYQAAIAIEDDNAKSWHNLGVACDRAQRPDCAVPAFRRAYELDRTLDRRGSYVGVATQAAVAAQASGDHARAAGLLKDLTTLVPEHLGAWLLLAESYKALGKSGEELIARAEAEAIMADGGVP